MIFEVDVIDFFKFYLGIYVIVAALGVFHALGQGGIVIELCVGLFAFFLQICLSLEIAGTCHLITRGSGVTRLILTVSSCDDGLQYHILQPVVLHDGVPRYLSCCLVYSIIMILTRDWSLDKLDAIVFSATTTHIDDFACHHLAA